MSFSFKYARIIYAKSFGVLSLESKSYFSTVKSPNLGVEEPLVVLLVLLWIILLDILCILKLIHKKGLKMEILTQFFLSFQIFTGNWHGTRVQFCLGFINVFVRLYLRLSGSFFYFKVDLLLSIKVDLNTVIILTFFCMKSLLVRGLTLLIFFIIYRKTVLTSQRTFCFVCALMLRPELLVIWRKSRRCLRRWSFWFLTVLFLSVLKRKSYIARTKDFILFLLIVLAGLDQEIYRVL